jgi:broad specificity phosphatase PhoE
MLARKPSADRRLWRRCDYTKHLMSLLYLVRHGQASFGTSNYDRLSPIGAEQAAFLRDHLRSQGEPVQSVVSGSLQRQRTTAEIIADAFATPVHTHPQFDEYDAGTLLRLHAERSDSPLIDLQGSDGSVDPRAFQRRLETVGVAWIRGELAAPELETWQDFRARVADALESVMRIQRGAQRIVVCTSAGVIGAAVGYVLNLPDTEALKLSWSVFNASVTRIQYDEKRRSLLGFNSIAHLEHPERRSLITYR